MAFPNGAAAQLEGGLPAGKVRRPGTKEVPSLCSAFSRKSIIYIFIYIYIYILYIYIISSSAQLKQCPGFQGSLAREGRHTVVFLEGAKNVLGKDAVCTD